MSDPVLQTIATGNELQTTLQRFGSQPVTAPTFMDMLSRAIMSGAAPEIIERLMTAQERWEKNEARRAYDAAVASARSEMDPIVKTNPVNLGGGRSYKYEGLDDIERAVLPALSKYGLTYGFSSKVSEHDPHMLIVTCRLKHKDGYFEENSLPGPIDSTLAKNPIQAIGSTTTYLARYTLRLALGLAPTTDDDAQAAGAKRPTVGPNVLLHNPDTRAGDTAARVAAPAPDVSPSSVSGTSGSGPAQMTMDEADAFLARAAERGYTNLLAAWAQLTQNQQEVLRAAVRRRHKPTALKADEQQESDNGRTTEE